MSATAARRHSRSRTITTAGLALALLAALITVMTSLRSPIAIRHAAPLLATPDHEREPAQPITPDAQRRAAADASAAAPPIDAEISAARFRELLDDVRQHDAAHRRRWLASRTEYLRARLVDALLAEPGSAARKIELVTAALRTEADPLVQAVLIEFLGLHAGDDRALATLDECVRSLLADASRPVQARLAVDGLLDALARHGEDPAALFQLAAAADVAPEIRLDLWLGLGLYHFDYAQVRSLVAAGLDHADDAARFGASEALRMFAVAGDIAAAEFVELLAPVIRRELHPRNRLLFLETLGAIGKQHAVPVFAAILRDPASDERMLSLAASSLALHGTASSSMPLLLELLAAGGAHRSAAITALGAMRDGAAGAALIGLYHDPGCSVAERRSALRSLSGRAGVDPRLFLDASRSADAELRHIASLEFLRADRQQLPPDVRAALVEQLTTSVRQDGDSRVRMNGMLTLIAEDPVAASNMLSERITCDPAAEVRGLAAGTLFLMGWARGDATLREQAAAAMSTQSLPVRAEIERQLAFAETCTPDELRKSIEDDIRLWSFVDDASTSAGDGKNVAAMKARVLQSLLTAMYGNG